MILASDPVPARRCQSQFAMGVKLARSQEYAKLTACHCPDHPILKSIQKMP